MYILRGRKDLRSFMATSPAPAFKTNGILRGIERIVARGEGGLDHKKTVFRSLTLATAFRIVTQFALHRRRFIA
jgi:hypothetical protein